MPSYCGRDTLTRVDTSSDEDVHTVFPAEYHGDPLRGGILLAARLDWICLQCSLASASKTRIEVCRYVGLRDGIVDSLAFVSRKRECTSELKAA